MNTWLIVGIIALVIGLVVSNLLLLKSSANTKFGSSITKANQAQGQDQGQGKHQADDDNTK